MSQKVVRTILLLCLIAAMSPLFAGTVRVKSLVFKGLERLSRFEIAQKAGFATKEGFILVDREVLERVLRDDALVESYKIINKNQTMTIIIKERVSSYFVYVTGARGSLIGLIDQNFSLISINRLPRYADPLILLNNSDIDGRTVTPSARKRIEDFFNAAEEFSVTKQLKQVDMRDKNSVRITLAGRPTLFVMGETKEQLDRLEYLAGYFDSRGYYPPVIDITGERAILR